MWVNVFYSGIQSEHLSSSISVNAIAKFHLGSETIFRVCVSYS